MTDRDEIEALRQAKQELVARFGNRPWFRGAGLARSESGLVLRLNVDPELEANDPEPLPEKQGRFPIDVVRITGYRPRRRR